MIWPMTNFMKPVPNSLLECNAGTVGDGVPVRAFPRYKALVRRALGAVVVVPLAAKAVAPQQHLGLVAPDPIRRSMRHRSERTLPPSGQLVPCFVRAARDVS